MMHFSLKFSHVFFVILKIRHAWVWCVLINPSQKKCKTILNVFKHWGWFCCLNDLYTVLSAARWSGWTSQSSFWISAFACTVALSGQNTSKCLLRVRKTPKIEPDPNFFTTGENFGECKRDWHNVRSYLFFNVRTFRTKIGVQWP